MRTFKHAIVRKPASSMIHGITEADLGLPDYNNALVQHQHYIKALEACNLEVEVIEADDWFPDACFIEDVSLCTKNCAIITRPAALARKGEIQVMSAVLQKYYTEIEQIKGKGTLDAGDVMMVEDHFYIGLSKRTNEEGANQLIEILKKHQMTGSTVPLKTMLHLKTGISYLEQNNLLVTGEFVGHPAFEDFNQIIVDPAEQYAANALWINEKVLLPANHPKTKIKIEALGYEVIEVDVSEYQKLDGGLSCLSLRF